MRAALDFLLHDWLAVETLNTRERFADHSRETFGSVLDACKMLGHAGYEASLEYAKQRPQGRAYRNSMFSSRHRQSALAEYSSCAASRSKHGKTNDMKNAQLQSLSWVLIYGGIFMTMLGLWVMTDDAGLGHGLSWGGGLTVMVGVLLIWLRSRRGDDAPQTPDKGGPR